MKTLNIAVAVIVGLWNVLGNGAFAQDTHVSLIQVVDTKTGIPSTIGFDVKPDQTLNGIYIATAGVPTNVFTMAQLQAPTTVKTVTKLFAHFDVIKIALSGSDFTAYFSRNVFSASADNVTDPDYWIAKKFSYLCDNGFQNCRVFDDDTQAQFTKMIVTPSTFGVASVTTQ